MRRNVFARYFEALIEGDWIAWGVTGIFVLIAAILGIVAWRSKVEEKRYQEEKRNRYLKK